MSVMTDDTVTIQLTERQVQRAIAFWLARSSEGAMTFPAPATEMPKAVWWIIHENRDRGIEYAQVTYEPASKQP